MQKNKKTIIYVVILVILVAIGLYWKSQKSNAPETSPDQTNNTKTAVNPVTITTKNIKETNFTGKVAVVSGEGVLAKQSQDYIDATVADFKKQADTDVPDMRAKFGADNPTANYEIDIDAKYLGGEKAQSVVMLTYTYTGGAHGSSVYKVITATPDGKILNLADIIKSDKRTAFAEFVKKELLAWKPKANELDLFKEDISALTFDSFQNWSLDNENLTIYFSQYEIAPGASGTIPFPIPISKLKDFLNPSF